MGTYRRYACLIPALIVVVLASCVSTPREKPNLVRFEFEQTQMNMPFRIVLYAPNKARAGAAARAAFRRIQELNDIMTDYDAGSELSRLSRSSGQGQAVQVSQDLWIVLKRAQELAE